MATFMATFIVGDKIFRTGDKVLYTGPGGGGLGDLIVDTWENFEIGYPGINYLADYVPVRFEKVNKGATKPVWQARGSYLVIVERKDSEESENNQERNPFDLILLD